MNSISINASHPNAALKAEVSAAFGECVLGLLAVIAVFLAGMGVAAYGAFVLTTVWDWFLVPAGYAAISFKTAIGLALIVSLLAAKDAKVAGALKDEDPNYSPGNMIGDATKRFSIVVMFASMILLSGFVWSSILN